MYTTNIWTDRVPAPPSFYLGMPATYYNQTFQFEGTFCVELQGMIWHGSTKKEAMTRYDPTLELYDLYFRNN